MIRKGLGEQVAGRLRREQDAHRPGEDLLLRHALHARLRPRGQRDVVRGVVDQVDRDLRAAEGEEGVVAVVPVQDHVVPLRDGERLDEDAVRLDELGQLNEQIRVNALVGPDLRRLDDGETHPHGHSPRPDGVGCENLCARRALLGSRRYGARLRRGGHAFLDGYALREVPQEDDVPDALDPAERDAHRHGTLDQEGIGLLDEHALHIAMLNVDDEVVHVPQEDAVVCVDLEADDLRNLLERSLTIPWPAIFDISDMKASVANVLNFFTIWH